MTFLLSNWRVLIFATLVALLATQTWRLDNCQTNFHDYEVSVKALAQAQELENERIAKEREKLDKEVVDAKDRAIKDLSGRYADARKRLRDAARSGGVSTPSEAPNLASACEPADKPDNRLGELEAALLDALERADQEMVKYRALWEWANKLP